MVVAFRRARRNASSSRSAASTSDGPEVALPGDRGEVAKAHGGRAGVDNRPGEGATFWMALPR